jgi:hypothetical protein
MEFSATGEPEERIAALEKKVRDMDALVRGLVTEFLDFKAIAMTITRQEGERSRQELKLRPVVPGAAAPSQAGPSVFPSVAASPDGTTVIRPRGARQPEVPVAPAEPAMARIMQSDGTMKMEPRFGENSTIDSSSGYGRNKMGAAQKGRQAPLIYAADEAKPGPAKK